jgi:hypothetical protein
MGCILHNSREPTIMTLYLNVDNTVVRYIKNSLVCRISGLLAAGISVYFIPYRKGKIRTAEKSGRFVTLLHNLAIFGSQQSSQLE